MRSAGLGGNNWQGVDDGWGRVDGLSDQLVSYLRSGGSGASGGGGGPQSLPDRQYDLPSSGPAVSASSAASIQSGVAASTAAGVSEGVTAAVGEVDIDLTQFINPSESAKRALAAAQTALKKEGILNQQAREEEDRDLARQREQRAVELQAQIDSLDPDDTVTRRLLEYEKSVTAIEETVGDRVRQNNRQIEDLENARELKIRQLESVAAQREAYEEGIARSIDTGITEESLKALEADISPIDYSAAIAELEGYRDGLDGLIAPQLASERAKLIHLLDDEVEKTEDLVIATRSLAQQYVEASPYEKFTAQQERIGIAFDDQREKLEAQIRALDQLTTIEELSEEQQVDLIRQRVAAAQAMNGLTAAQDRATASLERNYQRQAEDTQLARLTQQTDARLRLNEAAAKSIERFDPEGATSIRRENAQFQLAQSTFVELQRLTREQENAILDLNQAIADGNQEYIDMQTQIGLGTVGSIEMNYTRMREDAAAMAQYSFDAIAEQFPTVGEQFRLTMRDSFSGGLTEGIMGIVNGGGLFENIGKLFTGMIQSGLQRGAERLSNLATGALFGNGEKKGLLDSMFGDNEDTIPMQGKEAADLLLEGGIAAGRELIAAAERSRAIFGHTGPSGLQGFITEPTAPRLTLDFFRDAGAEVGESFKRRMPEAADGLSSTFTQRLPGLLQSVSGLFGGGGSAGGGGGIFGTIANIVGSFFSAGGFVANYASGGFMGGLMDAYKREKAGGGGGRPQFAVVNDREFIIQGDATQSLRKEYGDRFLHALNKGVVEIPNYASGGFASSIQPVPMPSYGGGQMRGAAMSFNVKYQEIDGRKYVPMEEVNAMMTNLQQQVDTKATAAESAETTFNLMREFPEVRSSIGI